MCAKQRISTCPVLFVVWLKLTDACAGVIGNSVVQYAENLSRSYTKPK